MDAVSAISASGAFEQMDPAASELGVCACVPLSGRDSGPVLGLEISPGSSSAANFSQLAKLLVAEPAPGPKMAFNSWLRHAQCSVRADKANCLGSAMAEDGDKATPRKLSFRFPIALK